MRTIFTLTILLLTCASFGQTLTKIKVSVPNNTDEVFIVGNQESLGDWQPNKIKLNKIAEYEREISLNLSFPAEFKFTRGSWNSEAIITKLSGQANLVLNENTTHQYYHIKAWTDEINSFSTFSEFNIVEINAETLNQKRRIYVSLPENYLSNIKYPVIYITDAQNLNNFEIA